MLQERKETMNNTKILPPMIYSGDIVRIESAHPYMREADILQQVMHGEEIDRDESYKDKRYFSFDCCDGATADQVTELYRFVKTDCGASYKLIWHRPATGTPSSHRFTSTLDLCSPDTKVYEITCVSSDGFESGRESISWRSLDPAEVISKAYKHYMYMFTETDLDDTSDVPVSRESFGDAMTAGFAGSYTDGYIAIQGTGCHIQYEADAFSIGFEAQKAERKEGRWLDATVGDMPVQVCDQCNTFFPLAYTGGGHAYCPSCGAKMHFENEDMKDAEAQEMDLLNYAGNAKPAYVIECDSCGNVSAVASDHKRYCPVCGPDVITPIRVRKFSDYCKEVRS